MPLFSDVPATSTNQIDTSMKILSPAFENQQNIPVKYTCDGNNINPPLEISGVPDNAKSLVLIVDDPDAPNGTWIHWTIWNINPQTELIAENSVPAGAVQGKTSAGSNNFGGPCPPSGTHRYFFKLFALDSAIDLPASVDVQDLQAAIRGHIIESAELIGLYSRR